MPRHVHPIATTVIGIIAVAALVMPMAGCNPNASPRQITVDAGETLRDTMRVLNTARRSGDIDDATYRTLDPFVRAVEVAYDSMVEDAIANNLSGWESAHRAFTKALDALLAQRLKVERRVQPAIGPPMPTPAITEATIIAGLGLLANLLMRLRKEGRKELTDEEVEETRTKLGIEFADWKSLAPPDEGDPVG